jgi:hypothetical protein
MPSKPTSEIFCGIWMELSSKARIAPSANFVRGDDCSELPPMIGDKSLGCLKARLGAPIAVNNWSGRETRCFQFFLPTNVTKFSCSPWSRPAKMGDFLVTELKQMTSCFTRAKLLVDKDRGTHESEIRIDGYQWYVSTDILEIAQVHFPRQMDEGCHKSDGSKVRPLLGGY